VLLHYLVGTEWGKLSQRFIDPAIIVPIFLGHHVFIIAPFQRAFMPMSAYIGYVTGKTYAALLLLVTICDSEPGPLLFFLVKQCKV